MYEVPCFEVLLIDSPSDVITASVTVEDLGPGSGQDF